MQLDLKQMRRDLVELSWELKNPHLNAALSCLPIVVSRYNRRPKTILILSKGHAYLAQVVCLRAMGMTPRTPYTHPEADVENGIWCRTGSLGHGLPVAIGLALALPSRHVDCILGDNECMEGTFWECLNIIDAFNIRNIDVHIDCNGRGATDVVFGDMFKLLKGHTAVSFWPTKRGEGIRYCEAHPDWHKHDLDEDDIAAIRKELRYA